MPKKSRPIFLIFTTVAVICLVALIPSAVKAQGDLKLSILEIDLWPEYDRPSVLVIYRITLPADTSLPVDLTLRIPASAGEPNAVAVKQADGGLFTVAHDRQVSGEWGLINITATMPEIQVEYYDPGLVKEGTTRYFEYHWPGDYAVDSLAVQVQQPVGVTGMRISPASDDRTTGPDGLMYYNKLVGSLAAGQTFNITIDYEKTSDSMSAESLKVEPSAPVTGTTSGSRNLMAVLPWFLGVLGVILIVGGAWWYWQSGRGTDRPQPRRKRKSAASRKIGGPEEHAYCHQCGKRAAPGDRYCRACGTELRVE